MSSGVMSLNRIPGFGKSGTSRMYCRRSRGVSVAVMAGGTSREQPRARRHLAAQALRVRPAQVDHPGRQERLDLAERPLHAAAPALVAEAPARRPADVLIVAAAF